jgi:hypothetical protein
MIVACPCRLICKTGDNYFSEAVIAQRIDRAFDAAGVILKSASTSALSPMS